MGRLKHEPKCPSCGKILDGYQGVSNTEAVPGPGCLTICVYCDALLETTPEMQFKIFDLSLASKSTRAEIARALYIIRQVRAERVRMN